MQFFVRKNGAACIVAALRQLRFCESVELTTRYAAILKLGIIMILLTYTARCPEFAAISVVTPLIQDGQDVAVLLTLLGFPRVTHAA